MDKKITVGITIGDYNGIGPEIIVKALSNQWLFEKIIPVVYSPINILNYYNNHISNSSFLYSKITNTSNIKPNRVNVVNINSNEQKIEPGKIRADAGELAYQSIKLATDDLSKNALDVIITSPINKKTIQNHSFNFSGHTEFFTEMSNASNSLMFMIHDQLKVGLVTNHLPIHQISENLSVEKIINKISIMNHSLINDFNIQKPKIAIMGLNPHNGDDGHIGQEEETIIIPAIKQAKENGFFVFGPFAADGFFANNHYQHFDAILAMYHDQGLIPFKTLSNNEGVNYTAGLPIIRTSPDHGTAYDIAGKNIADANSLINSIFLAKNIFNQRLENKNLKQNPLNSLIPT